MNERKPAALAGAPRDERTAVPPVSPAVPLARPVSALEAHPRRPPSKFGAAVEGWDAYNTWLDRVRQPTQPSRQAVIAKSL